jgi:microcystin-dependent protein
LENFDFLLYLQHLYYDYEEVDYSNAAANTTMKTSMVGNTGNGTPVNNMQPYLSIGYYIATEGIFPSRD